MIDNLPTLLDTLKRLQAETAAELDALLPSILQSSPGFDAAGDRAFKGELWFSGHHFAQLPIKPASTDILKP